VVFNHPEGLGALSGIEINGHEYSDWWNIYSQYNGYSYIEDGDTLMFEFNLRGGRTILFTEIPDGADFMIWEIPLMGYEAYIVAPGVGTMWDGNKYAYGYIYNGTHTKVQFFNNYVGLFEPTANITLRKILNGDYNAWGADNNTIFRARIKDVSTGEYLIFDWRYEYIGTSWTGSYIEFSANNPARLIGLDADRMYEVEEENGEHYTLINVSGLESSLYPEETRDVYLTNEYENATASFTIKKVATGAYAAWGVTNSTTYKARVKNITDGTYLIFNAGYECVGESATGSVVEFSIGAPVTLTGLISGKTYMVEEMLPMDSPYSYQVEYDGAISSDVIVSPGYSHVATVFNIYNAPTGDLIINKRLAGSHDDWGVNNNTIFRARVKDVESNNYLIFDSNYEYTGTKSAIGTYVEFSVGQPVILTKLEADRTYLIEEVSGTNYIINYKYPGPEDNVTIVGNSNSTVTITNTYEHGTGELIINKRLAGSYTDWGVDNNTTFKVAVFDHGDAGTPHVPPERLRFIKIENGYRCVGNDSEGFSELPPHGGAWQPEDWTNEIIINSGSATNITNLWANQRYEVIEIEGSHYEATYTGNNETFPDGGNMRVTITNMFEHATGNLIINKNLAGGYTDWGVDNNTTFKLEVFDHGEMGTPHSPPQRLRFIETDSGYRCVGNDDDGFSELPPHGGAWQPEDWTNEIIISKGSPVNITNLWANQIYEVIEHGGAHYVATYIGNNVEFPDGGNGIITITNTYEHGTGYLIINKWLDGNYTDWGVNSSTTFKAKIYDETAGNYLIFKNYKELDSSYRCVGNDYDGLSEEYFGTTIDEVEFRSGVSTILSNLWANHTYTVEEISGTQYVASYIGNTSLLLESENISVIVINNYEPLIADATIDLTKTISGIVSTDEEFIFYIEEVMDGYGTPMMGGYTNSTTIDGVGIGGEDFAFEINDLEAGTYYYKIYEENAGETIGYWTYSGKAIIVKVVVTNDGDTPRAFITYPDVPDVEIFNNIYYEPEIPTANAVIECTKAISGIASTSEEFKFFLVEVADEDGTAMGGGYSDDETVNGVGISGEKDFSFTIEDLEEGVYYYKITEQYGGTTIDEWTYSNNVLIVKVEITEEAGVLDYDVTYMSGTKIFTNIYTEPEPPEPDTAVIECTKAITGIASTAKEFKFFLVEVTDDTGATETLGGYTDDITINNINGTKSFGFNIEELEEGEYYYKITEENGGATIDNWTYSNHTMIVKVEVTEEAGVLTADVSYVNGTTFTNVYSGPEPTTSATISATKIITGIQSTINKFKFMLEEVADELGTPKTGYTDEVTVNGVGISGKQDFSFTINSLGEGEYYYKITEENGGTTNGGWLYSNNTLIVKVEVSIEYGVAIPKVTYPADNSKKSFTNKYTTPVIVIPLIGGFDLPPVSMRISKSLVDLGGNAVGEGKNFAVRIYSSSMTLIDRIIVTANFDSVIIKGLQRGELYYLIEEDGDGFTILGIEVVGIQTVNGNAIGIRMPMFINEGDEIRVIVKNRADNLGEIPDNPPQDPFTPPANIQVVDIPDDKSLIPGPVVTSGGERSPYTGTEGTEKYFILMVVSLMGIIVMTVKIKQKSKTSGKHIK